MLEKTPIFQVLAMHTRVLIMCVPYFLGEFFLARRNFYELQLQIDVSRI